MSTLFASIYPVPDVKVRPYGLGSSSHITKVPFLIIDTELRSPKMGGCTGS